MFSYKSEIQTSGLMELDYAIQLENGKYKPFYQHFCYWFYDIWDNPMIEDEVRKSFIKQFEREYIYFMSKHHLLQELHESDLDVFERMSVVRDWYNAAQLLYDRVNEVLEV